MAASFTALDTALTTAKSELATRATRVATAATAVAALATTTVGGESDNEKFSRLRTLLLSTVGEMDAAASALSGAAGQQMNLLRKEYKDLRGSNAITVGFDNNWQC